MAVGDDDLENRMSAKDRGIGSRGGDRNRIGPPPLPVALSSSTEFGDNALSSRWTSWLVPMFVVANVAVFVVAMFVNNCPKHFESHRLRGHCVARFLGRLSFEPLRTNPLFGPSSHTYVSIKKIALYSFSIDVDLGFLILVNNVLVLFHNCVGYYINYHLIFRGWNRNLYRILRCK